MSDETQIEITWHNDATAIVVNPVPDAPETFFSVDMTLLAGRTVPDGEKVKRAAWRIKAVVGDAEFVAPNAAKAVNDAIRAKFGGTKYHDVKAALADFKLPELADEEAPAENTDWTTFENAAELAAERDAAGEAAATFFKGEDDMRSGLKSLGQHIAAVASSLENNKAFKAWVESGSADLQRALANKNSKSELVWIGRLPANWFDKQPETSNSAKAYQRNFNIDKNELAEGAAANAWGKAKNLPKATKAQAALLVELEEIAENQAETRNGMLAQSFLDHINAATENGSVIFLDDSEGMNPAKDSEGNYIVPIQFGTGNRPHEFVVAFCKAMLAMTPEAKEEAATAESEAKAAQAVKPRTFAQYGVTEAAMHLARILSSREDWSDVLDAMNGMADRAEKETWEQVLSDVKEGVDAEAAKAEAEAAENAGDDDA